MSNYKIPLKDLCLENAWGKYGIPASAEDFDATKTRYLRITDISDNGELLDNDKKSVTASDIEKYLLNEGDIVFARTGNSTGRTYFHEDKNGKLAFAGFLIKYALDKKKVNPKYLKFYTLSNEYKNWVKNLSVGSTRGNINAQTFGDCPITVIDRKQQDLLVDTLSLLIDKIELNTRINRELEQMAKLLYDYWFVQFNFPHKAGKPYKTSSGKMVWNEELKREIPEGWDVGNISVLADLLGGGTPKTKEPSYWGGCIPFFTPTDNSDSVFSISTKQNITEAGLESCSSKLFPKGTIFITARGTVGNINIASQDMAMNQSCYALKARENVSYSFLYLYAHELVRKLKAKANGSVFDAIVSNDFKLTNLIVPPISFINKFGTISEPIFEKILNNQLENQQLASLRDWLLPMLMNGQVTVGAKEKVRYEEKEEMDVAAEPGV